jgi:protein phosphatase
VTHAIQFRWISASRSDVGMVREINEDACLDLPERGLWAVADGMGGHTLGDLASGMVIDTLDKLPPDNDVLKCLNEARRRLQTVNSQLRTEAAIRNARVIGSTVVVLIACDAYCGYLWAGDSRLYLFREGRLKLLTRDHSQVEELRSKGELSDEDLANHPARNLITRAVGGADTLDLEEETIQASDGDMFLLCSDGLNTMVTDDEMHTVLASGDCRHASELLIDMALERGGRDNISAVVVRAEDIHSTEKTLLNPAV